MRSVARKKQAAIPHRLDHETMHRRDTLLHDWSALEREAVMSLETPLKFLPDSLVRPVADIFVARNLQIESRKLRRAHAVKRKAALVARVDKLVRRGLDFGQYAQPCERIDALELG